MSQKRYMTGGSGMRAGFPRTSLSSLDDIAVDNPQPGEGLVWNGTNWENAVISGGGNSNVSYFLNVGVGSLPGYNLLDTKPHNDAASTDGNSVRAATSPVSMKLFVSGELGRTIIQGGVWNFLLYGYVDIIAGATRFRIAVSTIATGGGSETLQFTVDTEPIDATTIHPIEVSVTRPEITGLLATDKLKIEIFAVTDSVTDVLVLLKYGSLVYAARMDTPIIIKHSDIPGLDYTVDGHTGHITLASDQYSAIANKASPVGADRLLIEDSESSYVKKNMTLSDMGSALPSNEKVKTSGADPVSGYLIAKLEAGIAMAISEDITNPLDYKAKLDVSLGTLSDQAAAGDDPRLSDSRTPTVHDFAGALHSTSQIAAIQSKVSDGILITSAAGEIVTLPSKALPTLTDQTMIEDTADGNAKKSIAIKDLAPWLYGTGAPPSPTGLRDGSLYFKYTL